MKKTMQTENQNIIQHGISVWKYTKKILSHDFYGMVLPKFFEENAHWFTNQCLDFNTIQAYTLWHDCGKALCETIDEDGKRHFPNHAETSEKIFNETFPGNEIIAKLIGLDMIFHTESFDKIQERKLDVKTLCTLYITALAEINSNAVMFGGFDSDSFKIKLKRLEKSGKKLLTILPQHIEEHSYLITRKDLPNVQKAVQASHAVFEYAKEGKQHPSLVILEVDSETELRYTMMYLIDNNIQFKIFKEPMEPYNGSITAICTESLNKDRKSILKDLKLCKM